MGPRFNGYTREPLHPGVTRIRTRQCKLCGGHAVAMQGPGGRPVCSDCIDPDGPPVEYICSVAGCGNKPRVIAMLDDDMTASVLVCEAHFKEIRDMAISHIELPAWLTDGSAYLTGDGNVVLRFDLGPEGD